MLFQEFGDNIRSAIDKIEARPFKKWFPVGTNGLEACFFLLVIS